MSELDKTFLFIILNIKKQAIITFRCLDQRCKNQPEAKIL